MQTPTPDAPEYIPLHSREEWRRLYRAHLRHGFSPEAAVWNASDWFVDARKVIGPPPPDNWIDELASLIRDRLPPGFILDAMTIRGR